MPIDKALLEILCCPRTKADVRLLLPEEIKHFNTKIAEGSLSYFNSEVVELALDEGLITVDGKTLYRIDEGIPVMLIDKGIVVPVE